MLNRLTIPLTLAAALLAACAAPAAPLVTQTSVPAGLASAYPMPATPGPAHPYPGQTVLPTYDATQGQLAQEAEVASATAWTAILLQTATAEEAARATSAAVATSTPPVAPTITTINSKPDCIPGSTYTHCHDKVLAISYDYPSAWGEIGARYFNGGYAGHGYQYDFGQPDAMVWAGGRSRDFSEGRGGFYTDFRGYEPGPLAAQAFCQTYRALVCREVAPGVVLLMSIPLSAFVCSTDDGFVDAPIGIVAINLPQHATITGFAFAQRFVAAPVWAQLSGLLDIDGPDRGARCRAAAAQQQYDAQVQSLLAALQSGTADSVTQRNYNQLLRLAQSIHFD